MWDLGIFQQLFRLSAEVGSVVGGGARLGMVFGWSMQIWVRGGLSWV